MLAWCGQGAARRTGERMQSDDAAGNTDAVADATAGAGRRFRLPPRTLLLVAAGLLLLVVIVAGSWAYVANSQRQAKIEAARAAAARDQAAQARKEEEWAAQVRAAENIVRLEAARKAHAAIIDADTPAAGGGIGAAALSAAATSVVAPAAPAAAAVPPGKAALAAKRETAAAPAAPAGEAPALGPDGCTLSGSSPQEFGTALGRCLEEFNRMEEGVGEAAAPARRSRR
ncbi:MAG TPA: hypothetical protein VFY24_13810 [Azospira sp.]|nr:hypothetical protein [Azospira sp.]